MTKSKKIVKVWAVTCKAELMWTRMRGIPIPYIFSTEKDANECACSGEVVVPCTITYSLTKPKK